jgi:hypothetical protein
MQVRVRFALLAPGARTRQATAARGGRQEVALVGAAFRSATS